MLTSGKLSDTASVNANVLTSWCDPVAKWTLGQPDQTGNQVEIFQPASSSSSCSGRPEAKCSDISKRAKVSPQHAKPQALTTKGWMPFLARFAKMLPPRFGTKALVPPPGLAHPSTNVSNSVDNSLLEDQK